MDRLTIAVSGMNAIDNPGPGIPVVRSLRESSYKDARIIGLSYGPLEPGNYMRTLVDAVFQMPYPSEGTEALLRRIEYIQQKEKIDVLIPNFDAELLPYIRVENQLRSLYGIKMVLPSEKQFEMRQKSFLNTLGELASLSVPSSIVCQSIDDFYKCEDKFHYPVVVKGRYYEAKIAYTREQVATAFLTVSSQWGLPIIIQQFVQGTEFNVIGMGDGSGGLLTAVPMRKLFITDKGKAWAGVTVSDTSLKNMAEKFVSATGWKGSFELEIMKGEDNEYYLLEVNPRMPAWVYLSTAAGANIPERLVSMALGKEVCPVENYQVGKLFIRCSWDMIVDYADYGSLAVNGELKL